jgi:hypothetical protein
MLSHHASSAAPQTVQTAPPVCGAKNLSSVRLYSAPQLHRTIVAMLGICARTSQFSSPELCHNQTDLEVIRARPASACAYSRTWRSCSTIGAASKRICPAVLKPSAGWSSLAFQTENVRSEPSRDK